MPMPRQRIEGNALRHCFENDFTLVATRMAFEILKLELKFGCILTVQLLKYLLKLTVST